MKIEETEEREAIWMKNRCKFRADDERRNELVDDKVENLDKNRAKEMINLQADNWANFLVSWTDEADELNEADEVKWDHLDQTSFWVCCRVISRLHIQCISFKSSSSLSSFECLVSS